MNAWRELHELDRKIKNYEEMLLQITERLGGLRERRFNLLAKLAEKGEIDWQKKNT